MFDSASDSGEMHGSHWASQSTVTCTNAPIFQPRNKRATDSLRHIDASPRPCSSRWVCRREGGARHMRDGFHKMGRGLFFNGRGSGSIITDLMRLTRTETIACRFYRWRLSANFTCPREDAAAAGSISVRQLRGRWPMLHVATSAPMI